MRVGDRHKLEELIDDPDAPAVVLLGHGYWRTRFGEDRGVVGRTLRVNDVERMRQLEREGLGSGRDAQGSA